MPQHTSESLGPVSSLPFRQAEFPYPSGLAHQASHPLKQTGPGLNFYDSYLLHSWHFIHQNLGVKTLHLCMERHAAYFFLSPVGGKRFC